MNLKFEYNLEKDIWCLLNYGKSSNNSFSPTKVYEQLVEGYGENPKEKDVKEFITHYLFDNQIDIDSYIKSYEEDWKIIGEEYQRRAENIFKVKLPKGITVYLTINNRCPYSIEGNYFFVSLPSKFVMKTIMHELWHFYTGYKFGTWEEKIGKQRYNEIKESLTVLLNVECKDLLPQGVTDIGYPQHRELRKEVLKIWDVERDVEKLLEKLIK
jgi:hypothetical protein